jgi:hypothetical protein
VNEEAIIQAPACCSRARTAGSPATHAAARITLIACGIGNTPIRALLEAEQYRPGDATLIHRARPARRGDEPAAMGCQDYGRIS